MASEPTGTPEESASTRDPLVRERVEWPTALQAARQLGVVALVVLVWAGVFRGVMGLPSPADEPSVARSAARGGDTVAAVEDSADSLAATDTVPSPSPRVAAAPTPSQQTPPERSAPPARTTAAADDVQAQPRPASTPRAASGNGAAPAAEPVIEERPPLELDLSDLPGDVSFARDVQPILERRCVKCHGGEREEGGQRLEEGLSLLTWADVMAGSTWGSVVEPGDPAASYLVELVVEGKMPDKEPRLLPREVRLILGWVAAGAPNN